MEKKSLSILVAFILGLTFTTLVSAQQQIQTTQYMHNKLRINPGFAGTPDDMLLQATYRTQWVGFEGAPTAQLINLNMPFEEKNIGVGINLMRYSQGISQSIAADFSYAYHISVGSGDIGLGLSGSIRSLTMDFTDPALVSTLPIQIDPAIQGEKLSKWLFNFGLGIFYKQDQYYIGISAPRIFKNNLDFEDENLVTAREVHHYYLMTGYDFELGRDVVMTPQLLFKYAEDSPADLELSVNFILFDSYLAGLNYRFGGDKKNAGESLDLIIGYHLSQRFFMAFSYDFTLSEIKNHESGSIEVFMRYAIKQSSKEEYENPRYF